MEIPQFLYVPRVDAYRKQKLIIETDKNAYWQVLDFDNEENRVKWYREAEPNLDEAVHTITMHKKHPFVLLGIGVKSEIKTEHYVKLGEMASDWYAQFWSRNKDLSEPKYHLDTDNLQKAAKYFTHWVWGDNVLIGKDHTYLINLEHGVSFKFNYVDTFFASFEDFESSLVDVQFLSGYRPDEQIIEELIIDAWNFLGLCERLEDEWGLSDFS